MATFARWLDELECPHGVSDPALRMAEAVRTLTWLLSEAVSVEYADHTAEIEAALSKTRKRKRLESGGAGAAATTAAARATEVVAEATETAAGGGGGGGDLLLP